MTKQEAIKYINSLEEESNIEITVSNKFYTSGEIEKMGISRQLLKYYTSKGYIRTSPKGKQKIYLASDVDKYFKEQAKHQV